MALFRGLTQEHLDALAHNVTARRYVRGEIILSQGDAGDGLYIVESGHVAISRQSVDGDELLLTVYEPGEYFGELALFDDEPRSATAVAMERCSLLFLARAPFRAFLESHPPAMLACLEYVIQQLRRTTDLADEIALLDVRRRLARRLLRLADQGMIGNGERAEEAPKLTQQQLADMTGATRESVNKHLNSFIEQGVLLMDSGYIVITDRPTLESSAE